MATTTRLRGPIAIDGPAASGKTSVGQALAEELGFGFLDTGLMYRAFALAAARAGIDPGDAAACGALAERLELAVSTALPARVLLGGEDVTELLHTGAIDQSVSAYSGIPAVRAAMIARQREIAHRGRVILAGRDIGNVVIPDAPLKLFITASPEERARRRNAQAASDVREILVRDERDHQTTPLAAAPGAVVLDSTAMTPAEVLARALAAARAAEGQPSSDPAPEPAQPHSSERGREAAPHNSSNRARETAPHEPSERGREAAQQHPSQPRRARRRLPLRRKVTWATFVPAFYWGGTYLLRFLLAVITRWKVIGRERVPTTGALMVVSNHLSNTDPAIISAAVLGHGRIRFMAKIELFHGFFGVLCRLWGAFPVRRFDADVGAMLNAERILKRGEALGMFPEGTRSRTGYLGSAHPGTALIALRSGATVLPCAITGTERLKSIPALFTKPRVSVTIGEPIAVSPVRRPTEAQVSALTDRIFSEISALLPAQYRAPYTGDEAEQTAHGDHPPGK